MMTTGAVHFMGNVSTAVKEGAIVLVDRGGYIDTVMPLHNLLPLAAVRKTWLLAPDTERNDVQLIGL